LTEEIHLYYTVVCCWVFLLTGIKRVNNTKLTSSGEKNEKPKYKKREKKITR